MNIRFFVTIKKLINTNILKNMTKNSIKSCSQKPENKKEKKTCSFANVIFRSKNSLHSSVIFDFECDNSLTFDKSRFVEAIISIILDFDMWIDILNDAMLIQKHDTMRVKDLLNDKSRELLFENTAYISNSNVILISINKLKNKNFF
jgi:hypothetical protein